MTAIHDHPDYAAFLAGIVAHPDDDLIRLVAADWLDEHAGDVMPCPACEQILMPDRGGCWPCRVCGAREWSERGIVPNHFAERAEFIRCQVACSQHTDCPQRLADVTRGRPVPLRCGVCEYCQCRRRSEELSHLFPILPESIPAYGFCLDPTPLDGRYFPDGPGITVIVSRGFVHTVSGPLAALREHLPAIVRREPVERVEATDVRPTQVNDVFQDSGSQWTYFIGNALAGDGVHIQQSLYYRMGRSWYDTAADATAALSAALLAEARETALVPA